MTSGVPIPETQFDLENVRSKVKVNGQGQRYPCQRSIQITHYLFCFTSIGPTIPKIWAKECSTGDNELEDIQKNRKNSFWQNSPNIYPSRKHNKGGKPTKSSGDLMSCSHFIVGTSWLLRPSPFGSFDRLVPFFPTSTGEPCVVLKKLA